MRVLLDTNVLVYDTIEDSEHHNEASKIIDSAKEIYILPIVVHEYIWVMLKVVKVTPTFVLRKLREYLEDPRAVYMLESPDMLYDALRMLEEDKASIKEVNEYIIMSASLHRDLLLATYDKELRVRARRRGIKLIP